MVMIQSREQRLAQLFRDRDGLQTKANAYDALVRGIDELPVPVHAYGPHWRAVARVLREDAATLLAEIDEIENRIADLERARDAAESWTPPETIDPQLRGGWQPQQSGPTRVNYQTVAQLLAEDDDEYEHTQRDAGI